VRRLGRWRGGFHRRQAGTGDQRRPRGAPAVGGGGGSVRDHPIEEENGMGASSPWRGIDGDDGLKCGEERRWLDH
jgi:hypothetical protein